MSSMPFDKVSLLYNFVETYILKDYQGSLDLFQQYLRVKKTDTVLDLGGGTGFFSQVLCDKVDKILVVDLSRKMLLRNKNETISKIQGDGCFLSVKDESVDCILCVNVLHHIHRKYHQHILNEACRVLKQNGSLFIIEVFFPQTIPNRLFCFFENVAVGRTYHIPTEQLESYLRKSGFKHIELTYPSNHSWKYVTIGNKDA